MGPLSGLRVVELGGIGPAPFGTMLLADLGAEVWRIERPGVSSDADAFPPPGPFLSRNVSVLPVDLTDARGRELALRMTAHSDVVVEGFRPGVVERLGLGPEDVWSVAPRVNYVRMTGWGQHGPRARQAGHDINYLAASGVLSLIGRRGELPVPPLNLLGDFGGGGMLLAVGVLAAQYETARSGRGQVVDAAMLDGAALLSTVVHEWRYAGAWRDERGANAVDGGAPFYDVYELRDGSLVAVGAVEKRFWIELLRIIGLDEPWIVNGQHDRARWGAIRRELAERLHTLDEVTLTELLESDTACVTRVATLGTLDDDENNRARGLTIEVDGVRMPAPAPRFSRTPADHPVAARDDPGRRAEILSAVGLGEAEIAALFDEGVVGRDGGPAA